MGIYLSGLFAKCSYLTALRPCAEEASLSRLLHQKQNGAWSSVTMHLPYLLTSQKGNRFTFGTNTRGSPFCF